MYGIKEIKDLFKLAKAIVDAIKASKEGDGKIDLKVDWFNFMSLPPALVQAMEGAKDIPNEWRDLDEEEIKELRTEFGELVDNEAYQKVFAGLSLASSGFAEIFEKKAA